MNFLIKNIWFFTFFTFLLFLLFLFGETYLSYYVFGLFSVFLLIFQKRMPLKPGIDKKLVFSVLSFLFLSILSLVGADSFYAGIGTLVRYFLLFAFLLTFLCFDFHEKERDSFLKLLFFGAIFLLFLAVFFLFLPNLGKMIPMMNLLFSSYGHNHIGTLFVMISPIGQYFYFKEKKKIYLICSFLFYLFIIVGFGRVLLLISLVQGLLFLFLLGNEKNSKKLRTFLLFFLFFLLSAFLLYFFPRYNPLCSIPNVPYKWQMCKSDFSINMRDLYWEQALQGFQEKPLFGHGLGGFKSISYKYRQIPELWSGFVHNDYLQILVEGGILGMGAFVLCLFFLVQKAARYTLNSFSFKNFFREKQLPFETLLVVSLLSFLFDIIFDFNFIGFFFLALIFFLLATLLYTLPTEKHSVQKKNLALDKTLYPTVKVQRITTTIYIALISFVIFYGIVDGLIFLKKERTAFNIFPYFHYHSLIFVSTDQILPEEKLQIIHRLGYTITLHQKIIPQLNEFSQVEQELWAFQQDPWRRFESFLPLHYFVRKDSENLEKVMASILSFFREKQATVGFQKESIFGSQKEQWGQAYVFLAKEKNKQKNFEKTVEYLKLAHYFDQWSLAQASPLYITLFHEKPIPLANIHYFLTELSDVTGEDWGDNREVIARMYFAVITQKNWEGNEEELTLFIQKMIETAPWSIRWFQEEFYQNSNPCFQSENKTESSCVSTLRVFYAVEKEIFNSKQENEYFDKRFYKRMKARLE